MSGARMVTLYLRGDQIATYVSVSSSGNGNGTRVILNGVEPLGTASDVFRVVITQINPGQGTFLNGQMVAIYAYPDANPPAPPVFSNLNPQHDQFQGRASSGGHNIFTSPARVVFDLDGLSPGGVQYGPGNSPPRNEQLRFESIPDTPPPVPCFTAGTQIATARGPVAVEALRVGDLIQTLDHGLRPLRWIGARQVTGTGAYAPVHLAAGAIGNPAPLKLSPQHRILIAAPTAELCFGVGEVLVAARHLANSGSVTRLPCAAVTYVHLMFDQHEIVFAEGTATESFHPGRMGLRALSPLSRAHLLRRFPGVVEAPGQTARRVLKRWEVPLLGDQGSISAVRLPEATRLRTAG